MESANAILDHSAFSKNKNNAFLTREETKPSTVAFEAIEILDTAG